MGLCVLFDIFEVRPPVLVVPKQMLGVQEEHFSEGSPVSIQMNQVIK